LRSKSPPLPKKRSPDHEEKSNSEEKRSSKNQSPDSEEKSKSGEKRSSPPVSKNQSPDKNS